MYSNGIFQKGASGFLKMLALVQGKWFDTADEAKREGDQL